VKRFVFTFASCLMQDIRYPNAGGQENVLASPFQVISQDRFAAEPKVPAQPVLCRHMILISVT
jgi:hypothetical protein